MVQGLAECSGRDVDVSGEAVCGESTDRERQCGGDVLEQCVSNTPPAVHENVEIAELLGDLVCGGHQPRNDAQPDIDDERTADCDSSDEVV